jgi:ATP-dependent helicase/nuclease subunit A
MEAGTLTIYSASAGSGKTYALAGAYLEKLFKSRFSYRRILAVTFTNKATAEMKIRILEELGCLADGKYSEYLQRLMESTGRTEEVIRSEAREILYSILHDFSRFSVSTIDSFFQKIIKAFAREIGLHSGFNIEIDHTLILSSAVDQMIASAATDNTLKNWLSMYSRANIDEGKSWDLRKNIIGLASELFNEKFRLLSHDEKERLEDKEFLTAYIHEMRSISSVFIGKMKELGEICLHIFNRFNLSDEMFYQRGKGIPGFIRALADGRINNPNSYVREIEKNPAKWCTGTMHPLLVEAIRSGLEESLKNVIHYYDNNIIGCKSSNVILSNIYTLGILSDVLNQVRLIAKDENVFLLSDAGELIYLITEKDQTPFIYEKVGNAFENYMIDEFQDTSIIQWKNFKQLIENSMAQGFDNLVVGDIKQSIYRWRNSDWRTLRDLRKLIDNERYINKPLKINWRSCSNIVKFNNALFSIIPSQLDKELSDYTPETSFSELFSEAYQEMPVEKNKNKGRDKGYVKIEFLDNTDEGGWEDRGLKKLPGIIESIQDKGYNASDIGILVRNNNEGTQVLKEIIEYNILCPDEKKNRYNYNIVSNESLLLTNSSAINFLIAVLRVLENPEDMISRALMLRFYLLATGHKGAEDVPMFSEILIEYSARFFPPGYTDFLAGAKYLPLWNIIEKTIDFFKLGSYSHHIAYLNSFQDIIIHFTAARTLGIRAFLEWWESEGNKKSILLPSQQDSIRVLTIHKSKGLEFGIVILPFLSWNMDHKPFHSNILWTRPGSAPFNKLGIVPIRYKKELSETIFANQYYEERYSAYLDNINLLYVALTRAKYGIFGFAPDKPRADSRIASIIKEAINFKEEIPGVCDTFLHNYFDQENKFFEFGVIPEGTKGKRSAAIFKIDDYRVNENPGSLRLKLHWENYFISDSSDVRAKINYGKLMHEIFEEIITYNDVDAAVRRKVLEGKIPEDEEAGIREKIIALISRPDIKEWFEEGNEVLNEATVLMPGSGTRRPDRIILRDGRTIIIDFKFGDENPQYLNQIRHYRKILTDMGYTRVEAFLWYVDADKIVRG